MNDMTVKIVLSLAATITLAIAVSLTMYVVRKNASGKSTNFADAESAGDMTGRNKIDIDNRRGKVEVGGDLVFGDKTEFNMGTTKPKQGTPKK